MSDQPQQALFSTQAHVFQIDPDTKKSWIPISKQAVSVAYYYDSNKFMYRILSVDGAKALINSTITSGMTFTKTSQKFGQWSDAKANTVYGLGFATESDLNKFAEKFKEVKNNVKLGTPPASPRIPSHSIPSAPHINGKVTGGSLKSMSSNSTGSYEDEVQSPGSHRSSSSSSESQMKYENDRLKKALAQSSANAKKWESEFQTLKNNNARLTAALQESAMNVEKWKEQLNNYKEENSRLRKKLANSSGGGKSDSLSAVTELEQKLQETNTKLRRKEEEVNKLSQQSSEELLLLREKNAELARKLQRLEKDRTTEASTEEKMQKFTAQNSKLKHVDDVRAEMEFKLRELNSLQEKMNVLLKS